MANIKINGDTIVSGSNLALKNLTGKYSPTLLWGTVDSLGLPHAPATIDEGNYITLRDTLSNYKIIRIDWRCTAYATMYKTDFFSLQNIGTDMHFPCSAIEQRSVNFFLASLVLELAASSLSGKSLRVAYNRYKSSSEAESTLNVNQIHCIWGYK